jgi:beta-lactamase regulating signal transducer with metallopeptidase domain
MTKFAIMVTLWIFAMCIILMLGEEQRTRSFKPEPKENDVKAKLEHTKRRADKKRSQKIS